MAGNWKGWHTALILLMIISIALIGIVSVYGYFGIDIKKHIILGWMGILVLILLSIVIAGDGVVGRWQGLLIDHRNRFALSRLQVILWTILILSAFTIAVINNLRIAHTATPTNVTMFMNSANIGIPEEIWAIMGITVTALVGSPLVLSQKKGEGDGKNKEIKDGRTKNALTKQEALTKEVDGQPVATKEVDGQLVVNKTPEDANWSDMFKGDYVNNAAQLDIGKIQMMYFTFITLFIYSITLASVFVAKPNEGIYAFPELSQGLVGLLAISNGGYLLKKAI